MSIEDTLSAIVQRLDEISKNVDNLSYIIGGKNPELMSTNEIAKALRRHYITVQKLFKEGLLTNVGSKKRLMAKRDEVMALAERGVTAVRRERERERLASYIAHKKARSSGQTERAIN